MAETKDVLLGLDVGERRIGVALGDTIGRLGSPLTTLEVDGTEIVRLQRLMLEHDIKGLVVGLPRNMSGEETAQTELVKNFVTRRLGGFEMPVHYQDESLTSVKAEQELHQRKRAFSKGDIDALAATYILNDYLEELQ
jgi:putative Holliday junction resolvase